jgi:hypothetical protein
MSVDAAKIEQLRTMEAALPEIDATDMASLTTIPEVLGYVIACARSQGEDEADAAELLVRFAEMSPDTVRAAERVLRPLGYRDVCTRLRQIAGRRQRDLAPLAS